MKKGVLSLLLAGILLELGHFIWWKGNPFLPSPTSVLLHLAQLASSRPFWDDLSATLLRLGWGSALGVPAALVAALAIHHSKAISFLLEPFLYATYPLPKVALFPLLLVFFGIGEESKVAMVFLGVFYVLALSALAGLRRIRAMGFEDLATIFRLPKWKEILQVSLPGALPEILTGLKLGINYGLVMSVVAEFFLSRSGIGVRLWNAWDSLLIVEIYACLVALGALGLGVSLFFEALHRAVSRRHARI